ncbi:hypothetical protein CSC2_48270 [Clostridium zeae]|uniref:Lactococcin 972 family bacteriocin n=1 Tax=Clostridium zeae TaxID=2759022 RepID=A0ABQ1EHN7_9CLOT|nr:hypothetical protein [Clostridium zeae]GFZ34301.1 hypothetical protein CSC2_48270 [Clostridium zeae]
MSINKIFSSLALTTFLVGGAASVSAYAFNVVESRTSTNQQNLSYFTDMQGSDLWTRGLRDGHNGYYFAYSYYTNLIHDSAAFAYLNNNVKYDEGGHNETAVATTQSFNTTMGYKVICQRGQ